VVIVVPDTSAMAAIRLFDEYGVNVLPVAYAHGSLIGALYRRDLIKWLPRGSSFGDSATSQTVG